MKMSIIAVALLSSFSAAANTTVVNNGVEGRVTTLESKMTGVQRIVVSVGTQVNDLQTQVDNGLVNVNAKATEALNATKTNAANITALSQTKADKSEVTGVKDIAVKASESAANAIQGVADTNARVKGVEASVSVVEGKVVAAQATASKAIKGVIANGAAIKDVTTRVDVVEVVADSAMKDAAKAQTTADRAEGKADFAHSRIDSNEAAFNQWAAQSTARADEIASGVAHNSGRLDKAEKDIAGLKSDVKNLDDKIGRVGSMAMAVGSLHYDGLTTGGAVAVGTYDGKAAIAAGAQFNVSERSAANIQFAYDGKAVGAGAGYQFKW